MNLPRCHLSTTLLALALLNASASGVVTEFFDPSLVAAPVASGTTSDTVSCQGYLFAYTRDKLFTGGGDGEPIGRPVRVPWPDGLEAQAVTTGPVLSKATISIKRLDGEVFDLPAFSIKLLANTSGAGANLEIMPLLNGEDGFNDPLPFFATGNAGNVFSFDTNSPPWMGNTSPLEGFDTYKMTLYVDYAVMSLLLVDSSVPEPSAWMLATVAIGCYCGWSRKKGIATQSR